MIAMLASRIGWRVGLWLRRLGVAVMKARAAHQQLVGVLEVAPGSDSAAGSSSYRLSLMVAALALVPFSGAQRQLSEKIGS